MFAMSASHRRAADSVSVSSTVCRSNVDRLMTLSTSAVAVCCCKRFAQLAEQARILDGDDGLCGEVLDQLDLLVGERLHLLTINSNRSDQHIIFEHWHENDCTSAAEIGNRNNGWIAVDTPALCECLQFEPRPSS